MPKQKRNKGSVDRLRRILVAFNAKDEGEQLPGLVLNQVCDEVEGSGAALAEITAYDLDPKIQFLGSMLLYLAVHEPVMPESIKTKFRDEAVPVLFEGIHDSSVSDQIKLRIGPLLELYGSPLNLEEYQACFKDFEAAMKDSESEAFSNLSENLEAVHNILLTTGILFEDVEPKLDGDDLLGVMGVGEKLIRKSDLLGSAVLVSASMYGAVNLPNEMEKIGVGIQIVAALGDGIGRWYLGVLSRIPGMGPMAQLAVAAERSMAERGVIARVPSKPEFSHGSTTIVDGDGSRSVMLSFRTDDGGLDGLLFLINDQIGIKDVMLVWGDAEDFSSRFEEESNENFASAHCSLDFVKSLVEGALGIHKRLKTSPPESYLVGRHFLGQAPLVPKDHQANLGSYMLETLVRSPDLVKGSKKLADHQIFGQLGPVTNSAYTFVETNRSAIKPTPTKTMVSQFLREIEMEYKEILLSRMAKNLEVESMAGRAKKPKNKMAAKVFLALQEEVIAIEAIPYLQELGKRAIQQISQNLDLGYASQREVNEASMKFEDEAAFDDSEGEWF